MTMKMHSLPVPVLFFLPSVTTMGGVFERALSIPGALHTPPPRFPSSYDVDDDDGVEISFRPFPVFIPPPTNPPSLVRCMQPTRPTLFSSLLSPGMRAKVVMLRGGKASPATTAVGTQSTFWDSQRRRIKAFFRGDESVVRSE